MPVRNLIKTELLQTFVESKRQCDGFLVLMADLIDVVWSILVDDIVEPVGKKQIGVAAPDKAGRLIGVVVWEIVVRDLDVKPLVHIPLILVCKGVAVVLRVSGDKKVGAAV